jgi:hypothetical protein
MKRFVTICAAVGAGFMMTSFALAIESQFAPPDASQPGSEPVYMRGTMAAYFADADKKSDGDAKKEEKPMHEETAAAASSCGGESNSCANEAPSCGEAAGCGSTVGGGTCFCENWGTLCCVDNTWPFCCCCKPGDPCKLQKELTPCCKDMTYGGWFAFGFYTNNDPFSVTDNDLLSFWDRPNELNLDQAWLYAEHLAKSDGCNWACGYRFDLVYGVDAQKTQAFGNSGFPNPQGYDNSWDNGAYGWALPQAYAEFAKGDLDIKVGHFFTLVGYEVVPATGNFFYSHSFTMFNAEPFTHTGALGTYKVNDKLSIMAGWVLGWDTGFDQFGDGNAAHVGFVYQMCDSVKYSYMATAGDLGWRGDGYSHSNVLDFTLSKKWEYVLQSDLVNASANENQSTTEALAYGVNNYLFYTINDCWKWGTRAEWYKTNQVTGSSTSFYEVATGLNYKVNANFVVRPEVKFNWTPSDEAYSNATGGADFNQTLFGMDAIYTF